MKTTRLRTAMVVGVAALVGCSNADVSEVADLSGIQSFGTAAITPAPTVTSGLTSEINSSQTAASTEIEAFRNPFAPPKDPPPPPVVEEPEPEPEPEPIREPEPAPEVQPVRALPTVRLLGFMNVGEPKVLVSYHDELQALAIGDMLDEMKVVKIEAPELTMLFDERDIKLSLFDQAWEHKESASPIDNNSRSSTRPRSTRPPQSASSSTSSSTTAGRTVSGIPGFGPSDGQAPGLRPPGSPGFGSTPGGTDASGLSGLPGMGTSGGSGLPSLPGVP